MYVVHTSAWQSVDLIRDLKDKGWPVFGETLAAFLYWTAPEADARDKGAVGKIQPPIRLDRDRDALWNGVLDGTLTSIGTDCQMYPHELAHRRRLLGRPGRARARAWAPRCRPCTPPAC